NEQEIAAISAGILSVNEGTVMSLSPPGVRLFYGNAFSNPRKGNEQEIAAISAGILSVNEGTVMSLSPPGVRLFY
ncbi:hypothetical protein CKJ90_32090, partial [Klebsiella pneumoniae]